VSHFKVGGFSHDLVVGREKMLEGWKDGVAFGFAIYDGEKEVGAARQKLRVNLRPSNDEYLR